MVIAVVLSRGKPRLCLTYITKTRDSRKEDRAYIGARITSTEDRSCVCAHIALDQTVMPSRSEADNEVDAHARRAIASRRSDAKFPWQFRRIPLESKSIEHASIRMTLISTNDYNA